MAKSPQAFGAAWSGVLALSAQYYADFSGYTDIAIGCAVLIGVELPENFRLPFLARSFADHWRRWHISLSNWFRDYVFTPLVIHLAPRVFRSKTRALQLRLAPILTGVILVVTMVLIGLWHGLGWNYAWWGFYNGVLVALSPALLRLFRRLKLANSFLMILLTFYLTTIGRILTFPRPARSLKNLLQELHPVSFKAFSVSSRGTESFLAHLSLNSAQVLTLTFVCLGLIIPHAIDYVRIEKRWLDESAVLTWSLASVLLSFALVFGSAGRPFLYIQF